jgi:hypothetical protein
VPGGIEQVDRRDEIALEHDRQVHHRAAAQRGNELVVREDRRDILDAVGNEGLPLRMNDVEPAIVLDRLGAGHWISRRLVAIGAAGEARRHVHGHDGEQLVAGNALRQVLERLPAGRGGPGFRNRRDEPGFRRTHTRTRAPKTDNS